MIEPIVENVVEVEEAVLPVEAPVVDVVKGESVDKPSPPVSAVAQEFDFDFGVDSEFEFDFSEDVNVGVKQEKTPNSKKELIGLTKLS